MKTQESNISLPKDLVMPPEWASHEATWLSWPHNRDTWPEGEKYDKMIISYCNLVKTISAFEKVNINVSNESLENEAISHLKANGVDLANISFFYIATNDAWCRDHGPIFVKNVKGEKALINWDYNAWGGKYPPYDLDNQVPTKIAKIKNLPLYTPGIVMEGGSLEINGKGTLLTTRACLLNKNRNPHLTQPEIENYLKSYLGVNNIIWLEDGILGDDTDGHIDDITRFVNENTIVTVVEDNVDDGNHIILEENLEELNKLTDQDGNPFKIVTLPMPDPIYVDDIRLPASYANFLIVNGGVVVPIFGDKKDQLALEILQDLFPDRKVVGVDCRAIVWGLGTIHCLSQQEPL